MAFFTKRLFILSLFLYFIISCDLYDYYYPTAELTFVNNSTKSIVFIQIEQPESVKDIGSRIIPGHMLTVYEIEKTQLRIIITMENEMIKEYELDLSEYENYTLRIEDE